MGFLTIAGTDVPMQTLEEQDAERVGEEGRTYAGALYTQVRTEKRRWQGTTSFLSATEYAALKTATANDAQVSVVMVLGGVTTTITARVRCAGAVQQIGVWVVRLDIREA